MMSEPLLKTEIDRLADLCKRQRTEIVHLRGDQSSCNTLAKSPAIRACRRMSGSRPAEAGVQYERSKLSAKVSAVSVTHTGSKVSIRVLEAARPGNG
jgi:hypothetical protein